MATWTATSSRCLGDGTATPWSGACTFKHNRSCNDWLPKCSTTANATSFPPTQCRCRQTIHKNEAQHQRLHLHHLRLQPKAFAPTPQPQRRKTSKFRRLLFNICNLLNPRHMPPKRHTTPGKFTQPTLHTHVPMTHIGGRWKGGLEPDPNEDPVAYNLHTFKHREIGNRMRDSHGRRSCLNQCLTGSKKLIS